MRKAASASCAALLLLTAACGRDENAPANKAAAAEPAAKGVAEPAANAAVPADAAAPAATPSFALAGRGLGPGLAFGTTRDEAVAAATAAFGAPTRSEHNDECGEGPMDFVSFRGLQLGFQDGRLAGWSLSEAQPVLRTARGVGIGSPRSALGAAEIDEESSLGPEFEIDGVGGILDRSGARVEALWAGLPCQFR
ncbi:MAG: hypothetical protein QOI38_1043 [Sphingomonadales bacterium]|jgi:hypothetical protein|nr:hypothetical protein [Sphingomonadales bacterium]